MNLRRLHLLFLTVLSVFLTVPAGAAEPGDWADLSWQLLREAGVHRDDASLIASLRGQCGDDADLTRIDALIQQMGGDSFDEREQATKAVAALGAAALPKLRAARSGADAETSQRAAACIARIEKTWKPELALAAVRVLVRRGSTEAVPALVRFLPCADFEEMQDAVWFGLDALTVRQGKIDPSLLDALHSRVSVRRAAAACIVGRRGDAGQRAAVRKLLTDAEPEVRLRAAQGLLAARDKTGLAALIALLEGSPVETAWQAEELLRYVAGEKSPPALIGTGAAADRTMCRQAWQAWRRDHEAGLDLAKLDGTSRRPGLMLLCDGGLAEEATGRVWLLGCDGVTRWDLGKLSYPSDARLLPDGRVVVAERSLTPAKPLAETGVSARDLDGKVLWRYQGVDEPATCRPLPDGNMFVAGQGLRTAAIDPEGNERRLRTIAPQRAEGCEFPQPLINDRLLCHRHDARLDFDEWRVVDPDADIDPQYKFALGLLGPVHFLLDLDEAEPLSNGHCLLAGMDDTFVVECNTEGLPSWKCSIPGSFHATRLPNGDTLVGAMGRVLEVDPEGKCVWSVGFEDQAQRVRPCLALLRIGFDAPRPAGVDPAYATADWLNGLSSKDSKVRRRSAEMAAKVGPPADGAQAALTVLSMDSDGTVREAARRALSEVNSDGTLELRKGLADKDPKIRLSAVQQIGWQHTREAKRLVPAMIPLLKDKDSKVRWEAANHLGALRLEERMIIPALIEAARDDNSDVRAIASMSLSRFGKSATAAIPALLECTKKAPGRVNSGWSTLALGEIDPSDERVLPVLIEAVQAKDANMFAADALGRCVGRAPEVVPVLVRALEADDYQAQPEMVGAFRSSVIGALGRLGPGSRASVPALIRLLRKKGTDQSLQGVAIWALGSMGSAAQKAVPILKEFQKDEGNPQLGEMATRALQEIQDGD